MAVSLDYSVDGATPLDPDELEGLIPSHITTRAELNEWESRNVLKAQTWLLGRHRQEILTPDFIRELHRRMFDETWRWAGRFRITEKTVGIDPAQIAPSTKDLCEDIKAQLAQRAVAIDDVATVFHHRLVSIHPFANGNGRHSRLMTDLLLVRNGAPPFTWGEDSHSDPTVVRNRYIAALRAADARDCALLLAFVRS